MPECLHDGSSLRTVTFLFSDIEGSTGLLKRLGECYGDLIAEHRRIVREAFGEHVGRRRSLAMASVVFERLHARRFASRLAAA